MFNFIQKRILSSIIRSKNIKQLIKTKYNLIKYNLKNYPIFILDNLIKINKDKVDEISNLDLKKEYKVCIACLSRFKNNIDSNPEKLIKSVIKSKSFQDTFIVFRIDKSDCTLYYKLLFKKYSKKINMCIIIGEDFRSRDDFPTFWEDTFKKLSKVKFNWYQVTSDDSYFENKNWINTLHKVGKNEGIFMVSDVKLNYPCQVWYLDDQGNQIFIDQPPTVNYPAIKSKVLDFLLKKYPNEPLYGPNMSIDTYWGMIFGDSPNYFHFDRYIIRSKQLNTFSNSKKANLFRKKAILENSTEEYRSKGIILLKSLVREFLP